MRSEAKWMEVHFFFLLYMPEGRSCRFSLQHYPERCDTRMHVWHKNTLYCLAWPKHKIIFTSRSVLLSYTYLQLFLFLLKFFFCSWPFNFKNWGNCEFLSLIWSLIHRSLHLKCVLTFFFFFLLLAILFIWTNNSMDLRDHFWTTLVHFQCKFFIQKKMLFLN